MNNTEETEPKQIIFISSRNVHTKELVEIAREYELNGYIVILPQTYAISDINMTRGEIANNQRVIQEAIRRSDLVFVYNKYQRLDEDTQYLVNLAKSLDKEIIYFREPELYIGYSLHRTATTIVIGTEAIEKEINRIMKRVFGLIKKSTYPDDTRRELDKICKQLREVK